MLLAAFSRRACLVVVLSVLPASVLAQGASTATIGGVVRDSSGAVLPGVTIEAASPALIEKVRSTVSDERGEYRLSELRPGTYTVTFTLPGFATLKRDGLELRTNFTARVDGEMTVSQIEETITVSGSAPLVDATSATQQRTVSRELLNTVPTAKSVLGIAALIPAVLVQPPNAQDVGGSKGERSVRITVHGGKTFDSRLLQDGMRYNALTPGLGSLEGTGRGYYVNPLAVQEVVVDSDHGLSRVLARRRTGEQHSQGRWQPVHGIVFVAGTSDDLQSNNLDDDSIAQGLNVGQQRQEGLRLQRCVRRTGADRSPLVLCLGPPLGHDNRRRQPLCRHERDRLRLYAGQRATDRARGVEQGHRRPAHLPGHLERQAHLLVGQAAQLPGSADRAARDRHHQERGQRRRPPATRGDAGVMEPAALERAPVRCWG